MSAPRACNVGPVPLTSDDALDGVFLTVAAAFPAQEGFVLGEYGKVKMSKGTKLPALFGLRVLLVALYKAQPCLRFRPLQLQARLEAFLTDHPEQALTGIAIEDSARLVSRRVMTICYHFR